MKKKGRRAGAGRARAPKRAPARGGPFGRTSLKKVVTAIEDTERRVRGFKSGSKRDRDAALTFLNDLKDRVRVACIPAPGRKVPIHWFGGLLGPEE